LRDLVCFYCGDNANEIVRDHVRPVCVSKTFRDYDPRDVVDCCTECNSVLGDNFIFTLEERAAFIYNFYCRKHENLLQVADWSDEELSEMGHRMRSTIEASLVLKNALVFRLAHLSKIMQSDYPNSRINHLRGIVTIKQADAYLCLCNWIKWELSKREFLEMFSAKTSLTKADIEQLIKENIKWISVINEFKYERKIPFELTLTEYKKMLK
jgi:hypothetical protein